MTDRIGQQFGNYYLQHYLGHGGFADVYLGEHIYLKTTTAIKILHIRLPNGISDEFLKEAQTIARLRHPHIVSVLDCGVEDYTPFLVMHYASHGTLRQQHLRGSRLPFSLVVSYVSQIADALQYAHDMRLIHRDIKPENMLLAQDDHLLLSDFGLVIVAHSTGSQPMDQMAGTLHYASPEQIQGKPRPVSDQYALAVVCYEWLSGKLPFTGSVAELIGQHLTVLPQPLFERVPGVSKAVEEVIFTALAKDPQNRFPSVKAFADALGEAAPEAQEMSTKKSYPLPLSTDKSLPSDFIVMHLSESQYGQQTIARSEIETPQRALPIEPVSQQSPASASISMSVSHQSPEIQVSAPAIELNNESSLETPVPPYSSVASPVTSSPSSFKLVRSKRSKHFSRIVAGLLIGLLLASSAGLYFLLSAAPSTTTIKFSPQTMSINQVFQIMAQTSLQTIDITTPAVPAKMLHVNKTGSDSAQTTGVNCPVFFACQSSVAAADVDNLAKQIRPNLISQISQELKKFLLKAAGAVQSGPFQFSDISLTATPEVGSPASTVTVTLMEQGRVEYFLLADIQKLIQQLIEQQAQKIGSGYMSMNAAVNIGQSVIQKVDREGNMTLKTPAAGIALYQFTSATLEEIKHHIEGFTPTQARLYIQDLPGVNKQSVSVSLAQSNEKTIPSDPQAISLLVNIPTPASIVQLTSIPFITPTIEESSSSPTPNPTTSSPSPIPTPSPSPTPSPTPSSENSPIVSPTGETSP